MPRLRFFFHSKHFRSPPTLDPSPSRVTRYTREFVRIVHGNRTDPSPPVAEIDEGAAHAKFLYEPLAIGSMQRGIAFRAILPPKYGKKRIMTGREGVGRKMLLDGLVAGVGSFSFLRKIMILPVSSGRGLSFCGPIGP